MPAPPEESVPESPSEVPAGPALRQDHVRYMEGFPQGTFQPEKQLTRAQAAQLVYRLLAQPESGTGDCSYTDVPSSQWYAQPVRALCALGLFAAVAHWNSWMDAMIYNSRNSAVWPAQFVIRNLLQKSNNADIMKNINTYAKMTSESMKMASVILAVLPILCVYPFLQKYFVKGMYTGSVKG